MENHSAQGDVTLICKNCGAISHGKVSATVTTDIDIAAFTYNDAKYIRKEMQVNNEDLYFKCSKDNAGSISLCLPYIDGILFITTFPCGLDSLVNEVIMRRIKKP